MKDHQERPNRYHIYIAHTRHITNNERLTTQRTCSVGTRLVLAFWSYCTYELQTEKRLLMIISRTRFIFFDWKIYFNPQ